MSREHWYEQLESEGEHELVEALRGAFPSTEAYKIDEAMKRLLSERMKISLKLMRDERLAPKERKRYTLIERVVEVLRALRREVSR